MTEGMKGGNSPSATVPAEFVLFEEHLGVYLAMRPGDDGWLIETRKTPDGEAVASFKRPLVHVLEWLTSEKAAWALSSHRDKLEAVRAAAHELLRSLPPGSFIAAEEVSAIELAAERMQVLRRDLDEVVDREGRAERRRRVEQLVASGEIGTGAELDAEGLIGSFEGERNSRAVVCDLDPTGWRLRGSAISVTLSEALELIGPAERRSALARHHRSLELARRAALKSLEEVPLGDWPEVLDTAAAMYTFTGLARELEDALEARSAADVPLY
ncbi:MAG: hypothetical protein ACJ76V_07205 [Thermoleophilaceae bacterium]